VKATATRLPSLASNVLKLKEEVLNPKPDANGWCLGRESVEQALEEMRNGRPVVVTDDGDRENEGDLIFAAETVSQQTMAFVVRHTSGVICTAMYGEDLDRLKLGPMVSKNEDPKGTAFAVTVDLKDGVTTGISAGDRARTIRALADPSSKPGHFCRPGHIFPLRARPGGVLERGGHTEAAVDMARLAGLHPAGGLCEIVRDSDGEMSRWDDLEVFAREHDLAFTTIQDLKTYREKTHHFIMSGRGKGGKGLGKGGAKRHRKVLRDNIQGITKPAIRRLARRGGVKRISGLIYEETRGVLKVFLENVIRDSVTYTEHARRKTVTAMDVVYALKRQGRTLYGFGG
jgi:3,4-dihydroxy-2-butanone 4-phosphate synthase